MPQTYRIRMSKGDQHFEAEGDKRFVLEMLLLVVTWRT
jgi:hypothetical protein